MFIVANGAAKQNIRSSRFPRRLVVFLVTVLHSSCAEVVIALRFSILHPPSFIPTPSPYTCCYTALLDIVPIHDNDTKLAGAIVNTTNTIYKTLPTFQSQPQSWQADSSQPRMWRALKPPSPSRPT